jgi:hypothetical protein
MTHSSLITFNSSVSSSSDRNDFIIESRDALAFHGRRRNRIPVVIYARENKFLTESRSCHHALSWNSSNAQSKDLKERAVRLCCVVWLLFKIVFSVHNCTEAARPLEVTHIAQWPWDQLPMPVELLVLPRVWAFCQRERWGFAHRWTARNATAQSAWIDSD